MPLHKIFLKSDLVSGYVTVGICPNLPVKGVSLLLGNDLAGDRVMADPCMSNLPCSYSDIDLVGQDIPGLYPACAVTRAMAKGIENNSTTMSYPSITDGSNAETDTSTSKVEVTDNARQRNPIQNEEIKMPTSTGQLIQAQTTDPELLLLRQKSLCAEEAAKVPTCFYERSGVLMGKWRPSRAPSEEEWQVTHQIVMPKCFRKDVLNLAHNSPLAGHLGVNKTYQKVLTHFYWPGLKRDVVNYCKSCHACQVAGKPNQKPSAAPLKPIPAIDEPFSRVLIDCVGPLPKTRSGNQYLLTIICMATRFPEAVPLRNVKAPTIIKALIRFFTFVGLPKSIQSDQGYNFMSGVFQQIMYQLGITQCKSSAYHPQSQGSIERFHQILKTMMRIYCPDCDKDWDEGIHLLMFAAHEPIQDSLGFTPFELVFGHSVRGPLKMLKEALLSDEEPPVNLLDYVMTFKHRLVKVCELAKQNLQCA